ncbi:MAG: T9SS C-terminal target domain-containing protein [Ignavibacteria bacterium]|nr:MAG: T9SS C-terminal target domain-containing protein [Ignavibacteria bacterium]
MQPGKGNYVVTFGGTRNRWGDYNGAWLDPADTNSVWFYTEFVHHTNNWGTWVTGARFEPFAVPFVFAEEKNIDFGEVEIGKDTVSHKLVIRNFGSQTLDINNVALNRTDVFGMALNKSLPASLNAFDSLIIDLSFIPTLAEEIFDSLKISSNDPDDPEIVIPLHAIGFEINSAVENILYASTAPLNVSGKLLSLNEGDGAGTEIGELGFPGVISLTIDPATKFIYGLIKSLDNSKIVVINSLAGDAHLVAEFPVSFLAIAHDGTGDLYGFTNDRKVYKLSLNGDHTLVSTLTKIPTVVATNPVDNQMWMFSRTGLNSGKLYKIDPNSGTEEEVSDVNLYPFALSFDNSGDLYAVYGSSSKLASIDPITGTSFDVGSTGFLRVNGLAINGDITVTSVKAISESLPTEFNLEQNYPNPFNPTTTIKYSIPQIVNGSKGISSQLVVLKIYDVLGREVATLVNEKQSPGNYEVKFDASELSSGAYIYKITTGNFVEAKKMMLMK